MHVFLEVGLYLEKPLITRQEILEFVKENNQQYILGGYRNGNSPLETNVSLAIEVPEEVAYEISKKINGEDYHKLTINHFKRSLREKYDLHREKEIFFAEISGKHKLDTNLDEFMAETGQDEGFSLEFTNEGDILSYDLNWDMSLLEPTFDNSYELIKIENLTSEQVFFLNKYFVNMSNENNNIFLSEDNQSGFILRGNEVVDIFSDVEGREEEILIAIQKATPETGKQYVDLNHVFYQFKEELLEKQQVLIGRNLTEGEKIIMFSTVIDLNSKPQESFSEYLTIEQSKKTEGSTYYMEQGIG